MGRRGLILVAAVLGTVALASGCSNSPSGSSFSSNPSSPTGTLAHGTLTAFVAGLSWSATTSLTPIFDGHTLTITGSDGVTTVSFTVTQTGNPVPALTVGTYSIGSASPVSATVGVTSGGTTATYVANSSGGFGSITISTLTTTGASGTFLLTLPPTAGGAGSAESVTNGAFTVTF